MSNWLAYLDRAAYRDETMRKAEMARLAQQARPAPPRHHALLAKLGKRLETLGQHLQDEPEPAEAPRRLRTQW